MVSICPLNDAICVGSGLNPQKVLPDAKVSVQAGQNTILYCISNRIDASYTWTKGKEPLNITTLSNTTGFLRIQNVSDEDAGEYVCSYTTGSGKDTRTRTFDVVVYSKV